MGVGAGAAAVLDSPHRADQPSCARGSPGSGVVDRLLRAVQGHGHLLASERCAERQLQRVLDELYPSGTEDGISDRTRRGRERTKRQIVELFLHGETQGNAPGSKWAALNAIVEYGDWDRPMRQGGDRFARAIDDGADKTRALKLITAA